ncbi:MAG: amidohydrolase [Verrucomicrobia bacterium]|nr:amidohydrolase [Verrucomicrobiota bacterium]
MQDLRISFIQTHLYWEDVSKNLSHFDKKLDQVEATDLILLPETFSTAFSMNSKELAEPMDGQAVQWLQQKAQSLKTSIGGSIIIQENGRIYNRFVLAKANGELLYYDKRHLFRMGDEDIHFTQGQSLLDIELKGWKIRPQICYDLRFPVWSRNKFHALTEGCITADYDLLIYVANWPEVRVSAWQKLLFARAIENQAYVAAVNRIGEDGNGVNCSGSSMIIDFKGDLIWQAQEVKEVIQTITLEKKSLNTFRKKFPVGLDADQFNITL